MQPLARTPVLGVSFNNVSILRLDQAGGAAPGNKSFKLQHYLDRARREGVSRLVSFGGPWSNHLHALAAAGAEQGVDTLGLVRGEASTPMLDDARRLGMTIEYLDRETYRRRNESDYLYHIAHRYGPCVVIPEGGAGTEGAAGCIDIGSFLARASGPTTHCALAVGTGTTLAGIAAGLGRQGRVTGISALKGADDLDDRTAKVLAELGPTSVADWRILHDYHCGGFARTNPELRAFMQAFEAVHKIPLEPVYTGKLFYAIYCMLRDGAVDAAAPVVAIHTGGLQGRRGFPWLVESAS